MTLGNRSQRILAVRRPLIHAPRKSCSVAARATANSLRDCGDCRSSGGGGRRGRVLHVRLINKLRYQRSVNAPRTINRRSPGRRACAGSRARLTLLNIGVDHNYSREYGQPSPHGKCANFPRKRITSAATWRTSPLLHRFRHYILTSLGGEVNHAFPPGNVMGLIPRTIAAVMFPPI